MGLRGPKPGFNDVACPNEDCDLYGVTGRENIIGNGTYNTMSMALYFSPLAAD